MINTRIYFHQRIRSLLCLLKMILGMRVIQNARSSESRFQTNPMIQCSLRESVLVSYGNVGVWPGVQQKEAVSSNMCSFVLMRFWKTQELESLKAKPLLILSMRYMLTQIKGARRDYGKGWKRTRAISTSCIEKTLSNTTNHLSPRTAYYKFRPPLVPHSRRH